MFNKNTTESSIQEDRIELDLNAVSKRILEVRMELIGGSRDALSKALGVGRSTVQHYENGTREPSVTFLVNLSRLAGVHLEWLITGNEPKLTRDIVHSECYVEKSDEFNFIRKNTTLTIEGNSLIEGKSLAFRKDWLEKKGLINNKLSIIEMHDDAMEPIISRGDTILVTCYMHKELKEGSSDSYEFKLGLDPNDEKSYRVISDGLYLISIGAQNRIRRIQLDPLGGIYIIADNPVYTPIYIEKNRFVTSIIKAKVEWIAKSIQ